MLTLTLNSQNEILIGGVKLVLPAGQRATRISIEAPADVPISRQPKQAARN